MSRRPSPTPDPLPVHTPALRRQTLVGTDKPAVMRMNAPTCSPIRFHYLSEGGGAGCQAPGLCVTRLSLCWGDSSTGESGRASLQEGCLSFAPMRIRSGQNSNSSLAFCHFLFVSFRCSLPYQMEKPLAVSLSFLSLTFLSLCQCLWFFLSSISLQGFNQQSL